LIWEKAVKELIDMINNKHLKDDYMIRGDLVIRESCGCYYHENVDLKYDFFSEEKR